MKGGRRQAADPERSAVAPRSVVEASTADPQLSAFVEAARDGLRARGVGSGRKGRAISVRVDPDLLAAAEARLGASSQTEVLNAGLAVLAGADTFGAWLMDQAGAIEADLDVDV